LATRSTQLANDRVGGRTGQRLSIPALGPTTLARTRLMSRIRATGTRPEASLERALTDLGVRVTRQFGSAKADFAVPSARLLIFVDGCFWHGCPRHYRRPVRNAEYWRWKISYNRRRDSAVRAALRDEGWEVVRVWEHSLPKRAGYFARRIQTIVRGRTPKFVSRLPRQGAAARRSRFER